MNTNDVRTVPGREIRGEKKGPICRGGSWHRAAAALVLAACALLAAAPARGAERWEVLQAIHWVENPRDVVRAGPCGELGPYQFRESTWRMHTAEPFSRALDKGRADAVAAAHYEWIRTQLESRGVKATPYTIALAWNAGVGRAATGKVPAASRDYATRVSNLVRDLEAHRVADAW